MRVGGLQRKDSPRLILTHTLTFTPPTSERRRRERRRGRLSGARPQGPQEAAPPAAAAAAQEEGGRRRRSPPAASQEAQGRSSSSSQWCRGHQGATTRPRVCGRRAGERRQQQRRRCAAAAARPRGQEGLKWAAARPTPPCTPCLALERCQRLWVVLRACKLPRMRGGAVWRGKKGCTRQEPGGVFPSPLLRARAIALHPLPSLAKLLQPWQDHPLEWAPPPLRQHPTAPLRLCCSRCCCCWAWVCGGGGEGAWGLAEGQGGAAAQPPLALPPPARPPRLRSRSHRV